MFLPDRFNHFPMLLGLILLAHIGFTSAAVTATTCNATFHATNDYTVWQYGPRCYQLVTTQANWQAARTDCQGQGGDLAYYVRSVDELANVTSDFLNTSPRPTTVWIGMTDFANVDQRWVFRWLDNVIVSNGFSNWGLFQPGGLIPWQRCVVMDGSDNYKWHAATCDSQAGYLCQYNVRDTLSYVSSDNAKSNVCADQSTMSINFVINEVGPFIWDYYELRRYSSSSTTSDLVFHVDRTNYTSYGAAFINRVSITAGNQDSSGNIQVTATFNPPRRTDSGNYFLQAQFVDPWLFSSVRTISQAFGGQYTTNVSMIAAPNTTFQMSLCKDGVNAACVFTTNTLSVNYGVLHLISPTDGLSAVCTKPSDLGQPSASFNLYLQGNVLSSTASGNYITYSASLTNAWQYVSASSPSVTVSCEMRGPGVGCLSDQSLAKRSITIKMNGASRVQLSGALLLGVLSMFLTKQLQ